MAAGLMNFLASVAILFPVFLIALSFHEFSHALASYLLGDDTAKRMGRLTLNPLAHLDFWGTIFLLVFRIGWAKPVRFNLKNFKHPRLYSVITAFAGPFSNFILALGFFFCVRFLPISYFPDQVNITFLQIFQVGAYVNVMLGTFNLLPIPPLDGSHVIIALLYKKFPQVVVWLYRYSMLILILLFLLPPTRMFLINLITFVYNFIASLVL